MSEQVPPAKTPTTDRAQSDRILGPKSWTALIAVVLVLGTVLFVVASVLTARPSVDPTVHADMLALANSQQPDPDAESRYSELIEALIEFDRLTERIVQDSPEAVDDHWSGTRIAWSAILQDPDAEEGDLLAIREESVRSALDTLEDQAAFDEIAELLRSPNLASNYQTGLGENGNLLPMYEWLLPNLSNWRHYADAVAARSRVAAEKGDLESAAERLESGSRLPGVLTRHATLTEHLVGLSIVRPISREFELICTNAEITPRTLAILNEVLQELSDLGGLQIAIRGEKITTRDFLYRTHTAGGRYIPSIGEQIIHGLGSLHRVGARKRLEDVTGYLAARRDASLKVMAPIYQYYEYAAQEAEPDERDRLYQDAEHSMDSIIDRHEFLKQIFPTLDFPITEYWGTRARITALGILLAMAEHRLDSGDWPTSLDHLVPNNLDAIPINPQTGDPFEYNHTPGEPPSLESLGLEDRY